MALLEKFNVIQHKAGIDCEVAFLAVETVAAPIYAQECGMSDTVVTMKMMSALLLTYNTILDHMMTRAILLGMVGREHE